MDSQIFLMKELTVFKCTYSPYGNTTFTKKMHDIAKKGSNHLVDLALFRRLHVLFFRGVDLTVKFFSSVLFFSKSMKVGYPVAPCYLKTSFDRLEGDSIYHKKERKSPKK